MGMDVHGIGWAAGADDGWVFGDGIGLMVSVDGLCVCVCVWDCGIVRWRWVCWGS